MVRLAASCAAAAALLVASAAAYEGTVPFIVRSSQPHSKRATPLGGARSSSSIDLYDSLKELGCAWDALLVLDVVDLHHSTLPSHAVQLQTDRYSTLVSVPYLANPSTERLARGVDAWKAACGGGKEVVVQQMTSDDSAASAIASTAEKHANHLIIITGTLPSSLSKRQLLQPEEDVLEEGAAELLWDEEYAGEMSDEVDELLDEILADVDADSKGSADDAADFDFDEPEDADEDEDPIVWDNADGYYDLIANKSGSGNNTKGPLLEHAQIFTTPIITALLVTFGIFLPILGLGVSALAGIQVPPQMMNIAKTSAVSQTRKDQ